MLPVHTNVTRYVMPDPSVDVKPQPRCSPHRHRARDTPSPPGLEPVNRTNLARGLPAGASAPTTMRRARMDAGENGVAIGV